MENLEVKELEAKLEEFKTSLGAIDEALAAEPENAEFVRMKSDLEEVIVFYCDKVAEKKAEEEECSSVATGAAELIGRACVISPKFKHGIVVRLGNVDADTRLPKSVFVRMLSGEERQEQEIDVAHVRLITKCPIDDVTLGAALQALYSDGIWYNCTVEAVNGDSVTIKYVDYDEEETLPLDRLRTRPAALEKKSRWGQWEKNRKIEKVITTPAGYKIPAALIAKPTDTSAQRQMKRKKLEQLKREQKIKKQDEEASERQAAWKSHIQSTQSKFKVHSALIRRPK